MKNLKIVKRLNLKYNGQIVGYRVTIDFTEKEYDISSEELKALVRDWGIIVIDSVTSTETLYLKGDKLYCSDGSDADTLTYIDVVDIIKDYDDVDIMGIDD